MQGGAASDLAGIEIGAGKDKALRYVKKPTPHGLVQSGLPSPSEACGRRAVRRVRCVHVWGVCVDAFCQVRND